MDEVLTRHKILALEDPSNHAWKKKQFERIVHRVGDCAVGRTNHYAIDFLEDVKCACAREWIPFDGDTYNELVR